MNDKKIIHITDKDLDSVSPSEIVRISRNDLDNKEDRVFNVTEADLISPLSSNQVAPLPATSTSVLGQQEMTLGVCPYCQMPFEPSQNMVKCQKCKTSYHEDCWDELKHCAVMHCTSRRSIK